jgi:molybdate transport system ATP-binding protein
MSVRLGIEGHLQRSQFRLDLSLDLDLSQPLGILGSTGAGKTTLLRVIAGLEPDFFGDIAFGAERWSEGTRFDLTPTHRRGLGVAFQDSRLLPGKTVAENLAFARRRARAVESSLSEGEVIQELDLDHLMNQMAESLSGGEQQRVALARALLIRPKLLLMDEPLSANDLTHRQHIASCLARWFTADQTPLIYVSHAARELQQLTTHLLILEGGTVTTVGETATLLPTQALSGDRPAPRRAVVVARDPANGSFTLQWEEAAQSAREVLRVGDTVTIRSDTDDVSDFGAPLPPQADQNEGKTE